MGEARVVRRSRLTEPVARLSVGGQRLLTAAGGRPGSALVETDDTEAANGGGFARMAVRLP